MRTKEQRAQHALYERNRLRAISEGTWNPRRAKTSIRRPTKMDLAWVAGYLEGEGCFSYDKPSIRVRADSIDREPVFRLLELFGGSWSDGIVVTSTGKPIYRWSLNGDKAIPLMLALKPMLSPRRQAQIDKALKKGRD